ncbi:hypothetical protein AN958_05568 [Leucoagaricus sp. SymC.cos]|nr:hypothetical protein AN958_05568 [Leucoagaricus sp. SymC.cos]
MWTYIYIGIPSFNRVRIKGEPSDEVGNIEAGKHSNTSMCAQERNWEGKVRLLLGWQCWTASISGMVTSALLYILQKNNPEVTFTSDIIFSILGHCWLFLGYWSLLLFLLDAFYFRDTITKLVEESESDSPAFWDVWVMVSLPTIFSAWQILVFVVIVVWVGLRKYSSTVSQITLPTPLKSLLLSRIVGSSVLAIGLVYFILSLVTHIRTLRRISR